MKRIKHLFKRRPYAFSLILLLALGGGYLVFGRENGAPLTTFKAERKTVTQSVSVTGQTKPAEEVTLAFEKSGRVVRVLSDIGDKVAAGDTLVQLDIAELAAQLKEAEADVESQNAKLSELRKGTRTEDIQIKQTELQKARQDLDNEYDGTMTILNDAYTQSDDGVRKETDELFSNDDQIDPQLTFAVNSAQIEIDLESKRFAVENELKKWKDEFGALGTLPSDGQLDTALEAAKRHLDIIYSFLTLTLEAVNRAVNLTQSTVTDYKTNVTGAITNVNTARASVDGKLQDILSQKLVVKRIDEELKLKLAGSTPEQIAVQEAQVKQALARAELIRAQISKNILRSPIAGVVTVQNAKVGEIVGANSSVTSVISEKRFQIEANIPEADITKIKVGDRAQLTLDAYGSDTTFNAHVVKIDPAETVVEGVTTYTTTFEFGEEDTRVRPRMTANLDIITATRENVLAIPQRAIAMKDDGKFVRLLKGDRIEEVLVKTGLQGSDGMIEVIEGLTDGDLVITSPPEA